MVHRPMIRMLFGIMLAAAILPLAGCGTKDSSEKLREKMTERALEKATGEKTDVDLKGGDVTIKTGDTSVKMVATDEWPSNMFADVPRFTYGEVEHVTSGVEGGMKKFNIFLRDVPADASDKYAAELKEAGWEAQLAIMGPQGNMISAQKGQIAVQLMHNKDEKTGMFVAFEVSE
jgi:hypothetical protein